MEVSVELAGRTVFLTGERVSCALRMRNISTAAQEIAWTSVQLQCECLMEHEVAAKAAAAAVVPAATSLCPIDWTEGAQVITSAPKVLLCDVRLEPGETKTATYSDRIPAEAPPSYRGKNVKFRYNLLIGTQKVGSSIEVVKVPLRVLSSPHFAALSVQRANGVINGNGNNHNDSLPIANPFLSPDSDYNDLDGGSPDFSCLQAALSAGKHASRQNTFFDIASSGGSIARLSFLTTEYKLGDNVLAAFDFSKGSVRCVQYSACLVCEENVFAKGSDCSTFSSRIRHSKTHDFCYGAAEASLSLEIPLHITPTFKSSLCSIAWQLHFEFVIACDNKSVVDGGSAEGESGAEWNGPQKLQVQTLSWKLPITVQPCDPFQVDVSLRNKHSFKFLLK